MRGRSLSETIADDIMNMIIVEKKYLPGQKIPNENEFSSELKISRTTLREAIRILVTRDVLEIRRGKGTFVTNLSNISENGDMKELSKMKVNLRDLYEMRMIFEPQTAFYAALRGTEKELETIFRYGHQEELYVEDPEKRRELENAFHRSIVKAAHNEFMVRLMPILYQAINSSILCRNDTEFILEDHREIMNFLKKRDGEGARAAMQLHIIHNMRNLDLD